MSEVLGRNKHISMFYGLLFSLVCYDIASASCFMTSSSSIINNARDAFNQFTFERLSSKSLSFQRRTRLYNNSNQDQSQEEFLEGEALAGAERVRSMSIEERTKRAMLAEAVEDRMTALTDELDALLGEDGMPRNVEDREEVVTLAQQIKDAQEQYKALVNGEATSLFSLGVGKE